MCDETNRDEETKMITTKRWGSGNDLVLNRKWSLSLSANMADRPADRRSVQDFVRNVINAVTNLQTRSNQRGNNEESSRVELNLSQPLMKWMHNFRFQDKVVEAEEPLRRLLLPLCHLLLSIPGRAILFNGQEGVLEGEQETLHQLQEANNQTSCIN